MNQQEQAIVQEVYDRIVEKPEVVTFRSGYSEDKAVMRFRRYMMTDIRKLDDIREVYFEDKNGQFRRCRTNSKLKTWKRDQNRFECSFSYGLYEHFRLNTQQMLEHLLIPLDDL